MTFDLLSHLFGLRRFAKQSGNGASQRTMEFVWIERSHERIVERIQDVGGQLVEVPAVCAIEPSAPTSKGECVIA